jgi:hypothetical protein
VREQDALVRHCRRHEVAVRAHLACTGEVLRLCAHLAVTREVYIDTVMGLGSKCKARFQGSARQIVF